MDWQICGFSVANLISRRPHRLVLGGISPHIWHMAI
jgi:hypothetical protein